MISGMTETTTNAPAPTREVLGDLLVIVAQVLALAQQTQLDHSRLERVVLQLLGGQREEAISALRAFGEGPRVQAEEFAVAWEDLKALLHRFAGEAPDA